MGNVLYLVHRLPYPPNKGDKVRSYHLLKHLAERHRVFLGTFIDDPEDAVHVDTVRALCADVHVAQLTPRWARLRSLGALLTGDALTLRYYSNAGLKAWAGRVGMRERIDAVVVFSSAMSPYADAAPDATLLVDFVDVDSAKWTQYAANHRWPLSRLYAREGRRLLSHERALAARAERSFFVTENETALFRQLAPESADKVDTMSNGVDFDFYAPDPQRPSPFEAGVEPVVFTGAMDYWPNIDAVVWFASEVLPALRAARPQVRFYIVGRSPSAAVVALKGDHVTVTGTVADVRPYLQHAAVVVAPLRLARGIQNKILEAMAMARPVVASSSCVAAIDARDGVDLVSAASAADFVREVGSLLTFTPRASEVGRQGRRRVTARYSWAAHLAGIDRYLGTSAPLLAEAVA